MSPVSLSLFSVVLLFVDLAALLVELLVQILALVARQRTVRLVTLLELADVAAFRAQLLRFVAGELAGLHALHDAPGLVRLALVHARIANRRRRTILPVVLLVVDVPARLVLLLVQVAA